MPLILDLIRHGEAGPSGPDGDAARTLTPNGRALIQRLGRERLAVDRPDHLFVSPYKRAQESARLLIEAIHPPPVIETLGELTPDHEPGDVVVTLAPLDLTGHVVLVGHQPLMGALVAYLAGGTRSRDGHRVDRAHRVLRAHGARSGSDPVRNALTPAEQRPLSGGIGASPPSARVFGIPESSKRNQEAS